MTKETLWLQILNQSLTVFILSKLTPKKTRSNSKQKAWVYTLISKGYVWRKVLYHWICPVAWQWHHICSIWRQCETRVNAPRKQKGPAKWDVSRCTATPSLPSFKGCGFASQPFACHISSRAAASTPSSLLISPCPISSSWWKAILEAACFCGMTMGNTVQKILALVPIINWRENWASPQLYSL